MAVLTDKQREAGWTIVKLGEAVDKIIDHRGRTPKKLGGDWSTTGHRVISALNIKKGVIDQNYHHVIDDEMYERWMPVKFSVGDVIVTSEAPMGEIARIRNSEEARWVAGQRIFALKPNKNLIDSRYMYYSFLSAEVQYGLQSRSSGTTVVGIKQKELREVEIPLPPLEEQKRIAGILGSLDDKIEANTRLIQTLSDYCVALVDSLKLFEGSRESTLGEIISFSPKVKKPAGEEYQFIDMSSLPTMGPVPETISSKSSWNGAKFENGDTLFARITPCLENGKTAIAMGLGDEPACGSTEFIVMRANTPEQVILPYGIARCDKFRQEAMSHMIGSTGRQRVKWQDLANIPVSVPSESDMQKIEKSSDIFGYFEALRKENLQLAETRDALIKRLIG